ncbi:hypothetical protein Asi03nite_73800 [Actinoplanes siamensis]|uniref:Uncharacterized protein n=1 Tax=Actinoplanes siamensis TaxID=1223317 RepID=A0A919NFF9_9ACTN|nr:hypothetical protein Asi03nite_73800 [Actinoplanes siamensis]
MKLTVRGHLPIGVLRLLYVAALIWRIPDLPDIAAATACNRTVARNGSLYHPEMSFLPIQFTATLYLRDKRTGKIVKVMYFFASVSHGSKNVITAMPTRARKTK